MSVWIGLSNISFSMHITELFIDWFFGWSLDLFANAISYCLVACTPQWMEFINQNSLFGIRNDAYQTLTSCQDYCITVTACVAIDFNFNENSCWLHNCPHDLSENNTFFQNRTNQYRLDRTCPTATPS